MFYMITFSFEFEIKISNTFTILENELFHRTKWWIYNFNLFIYFIHYNAYKTASIAVYTHLTVVLYYIIIVIKYENVLVYRIYKVTIINVMNE